jgi:two-component system, NtrC family, response regulator AtoC
MHTSQRVLLVEDDTQARTALATLLRQQGFYVIACASAEEAEAQVRWYEPAVALLDVHLPGKWGHLLGQELVSRCPGIHIILMTGMGSGHESAEWLAGVRQASLCPKPLDVPVLLREVAASFPAAVRPAA